MRNSNIYIKCRRSVEVTGRDVFLSDVAEVDCADKQLEAKMKALKLYRFPVGRELSAGKSSPMKKDIPQGKDMYVISTLQIVEQMEAVCPDILVEIVGETDCLVRLAPAQSEGKWALFGKVLFVCLVSFFGTGFTIMAYHNDVGVRELFGDIYELVMNRKPEGINALEVSYSIGLAVGIVVFFNHIGGMKLKKMDPTPIEVSIRNYEEDVDKALVEQEERQKSPLTRGKD